MLNDRSVLDEVLNEGFYHDWGFGRGNVLILVWAELWCNLDAQVMCTSILCVFPVKIGYSGKDPMFNAAMIIGMAYLGSFHEWQCPLG